MAQTSVWASAEVASCTTGTLTVKRCLRYMSSIICRHLLIFHLAIIFSMQCSISLPPEGIQSACSKFQYRVSYIIGHYIYSSSIACRILEMTAAYARRRHLGKNSISRRFCFSVLANSQTKRFKTKSDQPFAYMNV